jgi:tRNA (guanine-N7-)-methyltransferase
MAQKKLQRFAEVKTFVNVLEYPTAMQGKWSEFFGNNKPITLELACGKGEYAVGMAERFPGRNFIGIDLKGNRIWVGAKKALEDKISNVAFIRSHIDKITNYFSAGEVEEIWLTFPDPQLRVSKAKKRLTHPRYLRLYQQILIPGGSINLKTDSPSLYHFTREVISLYDLTLLQDMDDVYQQSGANEVLTIRTYYETLDIAKSNRVHYLQFTLPCETLADKDNQLKEILREEETDGRN